MEEADVHPTPPSSLLRALERKKRISFFSCFFYFFLLSWNFWLFEPSLFDDFFGSFWDDDFRRFRGRFYIN